MHACACSIQDTPFKTKRIQTTFPAKVRRKMVMPGYFGESKNGGRERIAKGFAKEVYEYNEMVIRFSKTAHMVKGARITDSVVCASWSKGSHIHGSVFSQKAEHPPLKIVAK